MGFKNYIWDEEFDLNVSRNKVRGAIQIHKFGATPTQSTNTNASIWDIPDTLYPWSAFNTPGILSIPAVNASDNGKKVRVEGLDENWNLVSEDFTLSSSVTVNGNILFKRVYTAYLITGETNVGQISFFRGATEVLRIIANFSQSLLATYTVPAGHTGYIYQGTCSAQAGADATGFMYLRLNGASTTFMIGHTFEVDGDGGQYTYKFSFPQPIPEKTDVDVRLTTRSNNGRYTAAFDILLIKNEL